MDKFLFIVITEPVSSLTPAEEAARITKLLESGAADFVHLRKPGDASRAERVLLEIPGELRERIAVHRFAGLAERYGTRYHQADGEILPPSFKSASRSSHALHDAACARSEEYTFLSPLFDSISKQGYQSAFTPADLASGLPADVVALGGVTPRRLLQAARLGFAGAAMLGCMWRQAHSPEAFEHFCQTLLRMRRAIAGFRLQFITSAPDAATTAMQAEQALAGGCRWVQVRMKDAPDAEVRRTIEMLAPAVRRHNALLLVDDRVALAASMPEIDGVHLGHNDMPRAEARALLGEDKIIGSTANTPEQASALAPLSDYLGVGPYRFTTTKKNLAPVLGNDGLAAVSNSVLGGSHPVPIVAIGGIEAADVPQVMEAGVQGVAVSGAIHASGNPEQATAEFLNRLSKFNHNT